MGFDGLWHGTIDGVPWKGSNKDLMNILGDWRALNIVTLSLIQLNSILT